MAGFQANLGVEAICNEVAEGIVRLEGLIREASEVTEVRVRVVDFSDFVGHTGVSTPIHDNQGEDLEEVACDRMSGKVTRLAKVLHVAIVVLNVRGKADEGPINGPKEELLVPARHGPETGACLGFADGALNRTQEDSRDITRCAGDQVEAGDLILGGVRRRGKNSETSKPSRTSTHRHGECAMDATRQAWGWGPARRGHRCPGRGRVVIGFKVGVVIGAVTISIPVDRVRVRRCLRVHVAVGVIVRVSGGPMSQPRDTRVFPIKEGRRSPGDEVWSGRGDRIVGKGVA